MINNCVVYQIINKDTYKCLYVGSTKNFLNRKYRHKSVCNIETNKKIYNKIRELGGIDNVDFNIIQAYNDISKIELLKKERYFCDLLKPECNMRRPYRSPEEIVEDNRRWKREYWSRRGHLCNLKKKERIRCNICNCDINRGCKSRHIKTKKHLDNLEKINSFTNLDKK